VVVRVGEVDHDEVEHVGMPVEPDEGVVVDTRTFGSAANLIERTRWDAEKSRHLRIEIDERID
jgi:hypothetical protein